MWKEVTAWRHWAPRQAVVGTFLSHSLPHSPATVFSRALTVLRNLGFLPSLSTTPETFPWVLFLLKSGKAPRRFPQCRLRHANSCRRCRRCVEPHCTPSAWALPPGAQPHFHLPARCLSVDAPTSPHTQLHISRNLYSCLLDHHERWICLNQLYLLEITSTGLNHIWLSHLHLWDGHIKKQSNHL